MKQRNTPEPFLLKLLLEKSWCYRTEAGKQDPNSDLSKDGIFEGQRRRKIIWQSFQMRGTSVYVGSFCSAGISTVMLHLPLVNVFISAFSTGILTAENLVKTKLRSCEESLLCSLCCDASWSTKLINVLYVFEAQISQISPF